MPLSPEVLATARSQRWDPSEAVRILLEVEIKGRDEDARRNHRRLAHLSAGKTFDSWKEAESSIPVPTRHALMTRERTTRAENLAVARPHVVSGLLDAASHVSPSRAAA